MYLTEWQPLTTHVKGNVAWRAPNPPRNPNSKGDIIIHKREGDPVVSSGVPWHEWHQSRVAADVWPDEHSDLLSLIPPSEDSIQSIKKIIRSLDLSDTETACRGAKRLYNFCKIWLYHDDFAEECEDNSVRIAAVAEVVNGDVPSPAAIILRDGPQPVVPNGLSDDDVRHIQSKLFWTPPNELMNAVKQPRFVPSSQRMGNLYSESDWKQLLYENR